MLVKGGFPEEMTLSWAMKDESVVAKQPWEGQASQDEGTKSPMYKKALMAGRDGGMLGSWTKLVELEQSNQRGAWWEKSLERLAGARAGRAWGPFLGLLDFIPRECPQRVLSRGVSKSGLWFEKHPLVAMGRMSREGEPCGLWWGGADRDWEMIHRRIWCVGPCRSWWWRVDVEGEGEERRGPPPTLVRVAIWWSVTSENVDCGAEMTSPLGPPVSSFVPSSLLWGLLSERTQKGASKMRLLPPDSSLGSCLFAMVDVGGMEGTYLSLTLDEVSFSSSIKWGPEPITQRFLWAPWRVMGVKALSACGRPCGLWSGAGEPEAQTFPPPHPPSASFSNLPTCVHTLYMYTFELTLASWQFPPPTHNTDPDPRPSHLWRHLCQPVSVSSRLNKR